MVEMPLGCWWLAERRAVAALVLHIALGRRRPAPPGCRAAAEENGAGDA